MPGEYICGIPPDEALAMTWDMNSQGGAVTGYFFDPERTDGTGGGVFACSAALCTPVGSTNELFALEHVGVDVTQPGFRFVGRVQARMPYPVPAAVALGVSMRDALVLPPLPARMYRLGFKLRDLPTMLNLRTYLAWTPC